MEKGGRREWGPLLAIYYAAQWSRQAKENTCSRPVQKLAGGMGGVEAPRACHGTGSGAWTAHTCSDKGDGRLVLSATGWLGWGGPLSRNLSFLGLRVPNLMIPGRGSKKEHLPPLRAGARRMGGLRPSQPAANTRP